MKGLFYGIGHQPNSQLVAGQIDLDDHGYVKVPAYIKHARCQACTACNHPADKDYSGAYELRWISAPSASAFEW